MAVAPDDSCAGVAPAQNAPKVEQHEGRYFLDCNSGGKSENGFCNSAYLQELADSVGLMVIGTSMVSGQDFPNKPIRIFTAAAGGVSDFTARQIAQGISGPLGQPVIVENRPMPLIATETVAKTPGAIIDHVAVTSDFNSSISRTPTLELWELG